MSAEPSELSAVAETGEDQLEQRLAENYASDKKQSAFDYIIVGSGAGGGPLAARLTYAGKKVLVIEAGPDPAKTRSVAYPAAEVGEVTQVPGYYGAASEDKEMSWMFSVRHYEDTERQKLDKKYNQSRDPDTGGDINPKYVDRPPDGPKQGVFYPRSSGIGGCTASHAMITIAPNASKKMCPSLSIPARASSRLASTILLPLSGASSSTNIPRGMVRRASSGYAWATLVAGIIGLGERTQSVGVATPTKCAEGSPTFIVRLRRTLS